jgi:hypothetical protein
MVSAARYNRMLAIIIEKYETALRDDGSNAETGGTTPTA